MHFPQCDSTVGKSALLRAFTEGKFSEVCDPTVGVDFFARLIEVKDGVRVKLQLWDTAGQERFRTITWSYYRNSVGALLLYDITRRSSFEHLVEWLFEARRHIEPGRAVFEVVACKVDLESSRVVSTEEGKAFAESYGLSFIETSAKTGFNLENTFVNISQQIYDKIQSGELKMQDGWDGIRTGFSRSNNTVRLMEAEVEKDGCC
ncbi:ras-related protein Rab-39B [Caerostris darwini]|uniref:Ras-related protein Rab-39B n=1 Tax=Caerostris darwini TaxID=1538125 RepID=A0AAV4PQD5_9ARAC|nr:ras-related protein Rab-39B [Caerostris darwini]